MARGPFSLPGVEAQEGRGPQKKEPNMTGAVKLISLASLIALAACGSEPGPGGLSAEEERGLDNAASMIDSPDNIAVPDDSMVANEAEIAAEEQAGAPAPANGAAANVQ